MFSSKKSNNKVSGEVGKTLKCMSYVRLKIEREKARKRASETDEEASVHRLNDTKARESEHETELRTTSDRLCHSNKRMGTKLNCVGLAIHCVKLARVSMKLNNAGKGIVVG